MALLRKHLYSFGASSTLTLHEPEMQRSIPMGLVEEGVWSAFMTGVTSCEQALLLPLVCGWTWGAQKSELRRGRTKPILMLVELFAL